MQIWTSGFGTIKAPKDTFFSLPDETLVGTTEISSLIRILLS
jgi:hypothetical protein